MEKDFTVIELFDIYFGLLTEKQREIFKAYYFCDLSLAEIAQPEGTTRQSVHETLKLTAEKLKNFEKTLKIKEKNDKLKLVAENCNVDEVSKKILEIIGR